jgi:hypothetical protein
MNRWYILIVGLLLFATSAQAQLTTPVAAKELLQGATDNAKSTLADDVILVNVIFGRVTVSGISFEMDLDDGKATGWIYRYYSPSLDETLFLVGLKTILGTTFVEAPAGSIPPLPFEKDAELKETWIDSPAALTAMKAGDAGTYLTNNPTAEILTAVALFNPFETPIAPLGKFWVMQFGSEGDTLTCGVYAEDGAPYDCGILTTVKGISDASGFRLDQNYPNPYSLSSGSATTVRFALSNSSNVRLTLHDALGREMKVLYSGATSPGEYRAEIQANAFPAPGLYFYRIESGGSSQAMRMIVVK